MLTNIEEFTLSELLKKENRIIDSIEKLYSELADVQKCTNKLLAKKRKAKK